MSASVSCTWCGNEVAIPEGCGSSVECAKCGSACGVPPELVRPKRKVEELPTPPPLPPPVDDGEPGLLDIDEPRKAVNVQEVDPLDRPARLVDDDEEDGRPYELTSPVKRCPKCGAVLEDHAAACPKCKINLKTGEIPVATFEPVRRRWEAGWPFEKRMRMFIGYEIGLVVLAVFFSWWGSPSQAIFPFLFLSATVVFILGSYDRVDLTRNAKGRITLSKTWRICFLERPPQRIVLADYESMSTSMLGERDFLDGAIVVWLLLCGILPGIFWFIFVFNRTTFQVALCTGHGSAALILYRGKDEDHMRDLAKTVSDVCQFPLGLY